MNYIIHRKTIGGTIISAVLVFSLLIMLISQVALAQSMDTRLEGKSAAERANIKAAEIAAKTPKGEYNDSKYGVRIELQSISKIERGVEVFARAWKGGQQLGFGKDGSVEWERFRIFNPPVLVPDPNGGIVREWKDEKTGELRQRKLREDPVEALRQSLAHTVSLVGKTGTSITPGKRGNTTSTFYPDADPESTSVDGSVRWSQNNTSWSSIRGAASGHNAFPSDASRPIVGFFPGSSSGWWELWRSILLFDTSSLPDADTISSATLSVYGVSKSDSLNNDIRAYVVSSNPASNTSIGTGDYDLSDFGTARLSDTDISFSSWSTSGYNDYVLNTSGLANISLSSVSKYGFLSNYDFNNTEPSGAGIGGTHSDQVLSVYFADQAGTTQDPSLIVEHYETAPVGVRKSETETTSSDTTLSDDAQLGIGLSANKEYEIHGVIFASSTSQDPDIKIAFTVPAGAEMDIGVDSSSSDQAELLQTSGSATNGFPIPAPDPVVIQISGTVKTGATSGTFKLQWAQDQSNAASVGVLRGSYLRASEM